MVAALRGDFGFERVAQELRNQWSDDGLRRRDNSFKSQALWMEDKNHDDDHHDPENEDIQALMAGTDLTEEGHALLMSAAAEAQQALVQVEHGRRTLKEARHKQHQVKMSRRYYRTSFRSSDHRGGTQKDATSYLRCGGAHHTANCPSSTTKTATAASAEDQAAPFICFAGEPDANMIENDFMTEDVAMTAEAYGTTMTSSPPTTRDAVMQGKAVIDGGATKTLGSVVALEQVMKLNLEKKGNAGLQSLDFQDRPVFGFGNSSRDQCVSTASMSIEANGQPGQVRVHALG